MNKILLISEIFPPTHGGSGRWFFDVYSRLRKSLPVFMVGGSPSEIDQKLDIERVNIKSDQWGILNIFGLKYYIKMVIKTLTKVRNRNIDHVHAARCLPEGLFASIACSIVRKKLVVYVHGEDVLTALSSREHKALTKFTLSQAETVICNSENSKNILTENYNLSSKKIRVCTPGIDSDYYKPDSKNNKTRGIFKIVTVGRLQKRKGHDNLIRAISRLSSYNIEYHIIGDGSDKEYLEDIIVECSASKNVYLHGALSNDEILYHYQTSDLFAMTNRRIGNDDEGFGIVYLEAQSCGLPVLTGSTGGVKETFIEGVTGYSCNGDSVDDIEISLKRIIDDRTSLYQMGISARQHVVDNFDWRVLVKRMENVFTGATDD